MQVDKGDVVKKQSKTPNTVPKTKKVKTCWERFIKDIFKSFFENEHVQFHGIDMNLRYLHGDY